MMNSQLKKNKKQNNEKELVQESETETKKKLSPLKRPATENSREEPKTTSPAKKQKIDHPVVDKILENKKDVNVPVPTHETIEKTLAEPETSTNVLRDITSKTML